MNKLIEVGLNQLKELGYVYQKETKSYIELKTKEYSPYERIKIDKNTFEITKDCKSGQGNRGWRTIKYDELLAITNILNGLLKDKLIIENN